MSASVQEQPTITLCLFIEPITSWVNAASLLIASVNASEGAFNNYKISLLYGDSVNETQLDTSVSSYLDVYRASRHSLFPSLNKINLLNSKIADSDYIAILDHDTFFCDLSRVIEIVQNRSLCGVMNQNQHLEPYLGSELCTRFLKMTGQRISDINYFNCGALFMDARFSDSLGAAWGEAVNFIGRYMKMNEHIDKFPFGNLSFSIGAHLAGIETNSLSDEYNQRNWGELSDSPVLLHYNNYDHFNVTLKAEHLLSLDDFSLAINNTNNRYWVKYKNLFTTQIIEDAKKLADPLEKIISRSAYYNQNLDYG